MTATDDHIPRYNCILCHEAYMAGGGRYEISPVRAWGGAMICESCRRINWDGVVLQRHPRLDEHLKSLGITPTVNAKGWVDIPN